MIKSNPNKALFIAKKIIAEIVTDVVNLEGINYTLPEMQTLLDGITVGGHKLQDELIALNQIKAWKFLFESVESHTFIVNKDFVLKLHSIVANQEALVWGSFRDGGVSISGTDYLPPNSLQLDFLWDNLEEQTNVALQNIDKVDLYRVAISLFAKMAKMQFFYDGNKRTGRMMMSGLLLSCGYPMINVPAKRQLEFNQAMLNYYNTNQLDSLSKFLMSCIPVWVTQEFQLPYGCI